MPDCLIGLGSNLGDRKQTLETAIRCLDREPNIRPVRMSGWHETAPVGGPSGQGSFLNGVIFIETSRSAEDLLALLLQIEVKLGRQRSERWGPRCIDLDLLIYGTRVIRTPELTVPHPRMAWRRFILEPATEVAASMCHPTIGWTIGQLLEHLNEARPYIAITGPIGAGKSLLADKLAQTISARQILEPVHFAQSKTFHADPSGQTRVARLEFFRDLDRRGRLLADSSSVWSDPNRPVVSDFWFGQSLAYADVWLPSDRRETIRRHWTEVESHVVRPKLIVLLDAPSDELLERIPESRFDVDTLERERRAICDWVKRPGWGPLLDLDAVEPDQRLSEVVTALKSME